MKKIFTAIAVIAAMFVGTAWADVVVDNRERISLGNKTGVMCDIGFDTSYNYGGEFAGATMFGLGRVQEVLFYNQDGHAYAYDHGTKRIKVLASAPPIVYEERHADSASSGDTGFLLNYPAAYIMAIQSDGATPFMLASSGATTLSGNWAALSSPIQEDMLTGITVSQTGNRSGNSFYVTYVTQAWKDVYDLLVQNQTINLLSSKAGGATGSGNTIFAFQCAKFGDQTTGVTPVDFADTIGNYELGIDFGDSGCSSSQMAYFGGQDGKDLIITYLKYPPVNSWLWNRWIRNEDASVTSGTSIMQLRKPLLMWNWGGWAASSGDSPFIIGYSEYPYDNETGTYRFDDSNDNSLGVECAEYSGVSIMVTNWMNSGVTYGWSNTSAGNAVQNQTWTVHNTYGRALTHATYVWGKPWEIPNLQMLQVLAGSDLSGVTTRALVIGY